MNIKQLNKLNMYLAVEGICDASPTIWQSLQAFAQAYADFKTHVTNIQAFVQSQTQNNTGIAVDKQAARAVMCNAALPIARAVHAYALKTMNNTIAATMDLSMSDLMGGPGVQSAERCQNIYAVGNANLANLGNYGVTAAKLAGLNAAIAVFKSLISAPRDTRAQGKTITGNLQAEFDAADADLAQMDDLGGLVANAQFTSNYNNARIIVDNSASHAAAAPQTSPTVPQPKP
jgi:hypothetical protein